MGAGIAQVSIDKGMHVTLKDMAQGGLTKGQQQVEKGFKTQVSKKKLTRSVTQPARASPPVSVIYIVVTMALIIICICFL